MSFSTACANLGLGVQLLAMKLLAFILIASASFAADYNTSVHVTSSGRQFAGTMNGVPYHAGYAGKITPSIQLHKVCADLIANAMIYTVCGHDARKLEVGKDYSAIIQKKDIHVLIDSKDRKLRIEGTREVR